MDTYCCPSSEKGARFSPNYKSLEKCKVGNSILSDQPKPWSLSCNCMCHEGSVAEMVKFHSLCKNNQYNKKNHLSFCFFPFLIDVELLLINLLRNQIIPHLSLVIHI